MLYFKNVRPVSFVSFWMAVCPGRNWSSALAKCFGHSSCGHVVSRYHACLLIMLNKLNLYISFNHDRFIFPFLSDFLLVSLQYCFDFGGLVTGSHSDVWLTAH